MEYLGIDIGGSALKGARVDVERGDLTSPRYRLATPDPSGPEELALAVARLARRFHWDRPIGCTMPGIVKRGIVQAVANLDQSWAGVNGAALFRLKTGLPVTLINDADAAGLAEMRFGAGRGQRGVVLMLTLGTGIGSAFFVNGALFPNVEIGHLEIRCRDAEKRAAASVKERKGLTWEQYARRLQEYLDRVEFLFSPDLIIIGGGISRQHTRFLPLLKTRAHLVPAVLRNNAGIVGAALAAHEQQ